MAPHKLVGPLIFHRWFIETSNCAGQLRRVTSYIIPFLIIIMGFAEGTEGPNRYG